jgi:hypothetical protein
MCVCVYVRSSFFVTTHTRTQTYIHTSIYKFTDTQTHTHAHTHTRTHKQHTNTDTHTQTHTHTFYTYIHVCKEIKSNRYESASLQRYYQTFQPKEHCKFRNCIQAQYYKTLFTVIFILKAKYIHSQRCHKTIQLVKKSKVHVSLTTLKRSEDYRNTSLGYPILPGSIYQSKQEYYAYFGMSDPNDRYFRW